MVYWCVLRREFSGMMHWLTINFIIPANPQQLIHGVHVCDDDVNLEIWFTFLAMCSQGFDRF
jgi:hypothetical protein